MDYDKYKSLLFSAKQLPEDRTFSNSIIKLDEYVSQNIPDYLYRFRTCTENNISAFWNDELWTSSGQIMNDDFESRVYFNEKEVDYYLESIHSDTTFLNITKKRIKESGIAFPQFILDIPTEHFVKKTVEFIKENRPNHGQEISDLLQKTIKFCCFAERIDSDLMWGQYANSATGFALSYHFEKNKVAFPLKDNRSANGQGDLYPVLYGNHRLDATNLVKNLMLFKYFDDMLKLYSVNASLEQKRFVIPTEDVFMYEKISLIKSMEWAPEKEWRLFALADEITETLAKNIVFKVKPCQLFLGRRISPINEKILTDIAREKRLQIFKMCIDKNSNEYKLSHVEIN